MSFVDYFLPCFCQWLITCLLLALLPFQPLFTYSSHGDQLLLQCGFSVLHPLLCASFYFVIYCSVLFCFFLQGRGQSAQGAMLVYHKGGWGYTMLLLGLTCLVC
jgi:hypothetical protein